MGVYVKGMEMPETCKLCYLSEFDPGFYAYVCKPTGMRIDYDMAKIDRPKKICPLVPVPEHGRLIDADAFEAEYWSAQFWGDRDAAKKVHHAPAIIPADKEGEG